MRVVNLKLYGLDWDEAFKLVVLSDLHIGNRCTDKRILSQVVQLLDKADHWILNGDIGDCIHAHPFERRFSLDILDPDHQTPQSQFEYAYSLLKPYAGKGLAITEGNHERVWRRRSGFDIARELASKLGVEYAHGSSALIRLSFTRRGSEARRVVSIYLHHGYGSARTPGGRLNKLLSLRRIFPDADIYLMGHFHELGERYPGTALEAVRGRVRSRHQYYAFTGGFIRGYSDTGSYIESRGYAPTTIGALLVLVTPFPTPRGMPPLIEFRKIMENSGHLQVPRELR